MDYAFPCVWTTREGDDRFEFGMTLRDYFAAKAMQAICSALTQGIRPTDVPVLAADAYVIADAMLKARDA